MSVVVDYTLPPALGERESASKRRDDRHWHREARKLRSLRFVGKSNGPGETGGPLLVVYSPDVASNMLHHKFPGSVTSRVFRMIRREA